MNTEVSRSATLERKDAPEFGAVIALGKNWRLPIDGGPRIYLSLESKMTSLAAGQMYSDGRVGKILFVTGKTAGKDKDGNFYPTEGEEMYKFMRIFFPDIPAEDVIIEGESFDTAGNAEEVGKILKREQINDPALLTVGFHMPRSRKTFANYNVPIKAAFSSESVLKGRNPHFDKFLHDYRFGTTHLGLAVKEAAAAFLVATVDPKGTKIVRKISTKTRNREDDSATLA